MDARGRPPDPTFAEMHEFGDPFIKKEDRYKSNATWVMLPTRDRIEMTKESLEAIKVGSEPDTRLAVVDNGSVDGTQDWLVEQFKLRRIDRLILNKPGTAMQWQKSYALYQVLGGLETETFGWFAWVDNDVIVKPGWLQAAKAVIAQMPGILVVNAYKSRGAHEPKVWPDSKVVRTRMDGRPVDVQVLLNRWPRGGECWVVRRNFFNSYGLPPVRMYPPTNRPVVYPEDVFYTMEKPGKDAIVQIDYAESRSPRGSNKGRRTGWTGMGPDGRGGSLTEKP